MRLKAFLVAFLLAVGLATMVSAQDYVFTTFAVTYIDAANGEVAGSETAQLWQSYCGGYTPADTTRTVEQGSGGTYFWFTYPGAPQDFQLPPGAQWLCFTWLFNATSLPSGSYAAVMVRSDTGEVSTSSFIVP